MTSKLYLRLSGIGLALALGIGSGGNASAQQTSRTWFATPTPAAQYYTYYYAQPSCPGGSCGARSPQPQSCPNGSCAARTWVPTAAPADPLRNGVQRVFSPVTPAPQSSIRQAPASAPSANRESPYYEYRSAPPRSTSPSPRTLAAPSTLAAPRDNGSPYYP